MISDKFVITNHTSMLKLNTTCKNDKFDELKIGESIDNFKNELFIKILDKKEQLKAQAGKCKWHPDYMKIRVEQWIDGLQWDWCISRQRFFGVKFPVWRVVKDLPLSEGGEMYEVRTIVAEIDELPVDPMVTPPKGYIKTYLVSA